MQQHEEPKVEQAKQKREGPKPEQPKLKHEEPKPEQPKLKHEEPKPEQPKFSQPSGPEYESGWDAGSGRAWRKALSKGRSGPVEWSMDPEVDESRDPFGSYCVCLCM